MSLVLLLLLRNIILVTVLQCLYPSSSVSACSVHAFIWKHLQDLPSPHVVEVIPNLVAAIF